jgi:hypothetical protein
MINNSFWDFVIISILYGLYTLIKVIISKKEKKDKKKVFTREEYDNSLTYLKIQNLKWKRQKYLMKKVDEFTDKHPNLSLWSFTLATMIELYFIYSVLK